METLFPRNGRGGWSAFVLERLFGWQTGTESRSQPSGVQRGDVTVRETHSLTSRRLKPDGKAGVSQRTSPTGNGEPYEVL